MMKPARSPVRWYFILMLLIVALLLSFPSTRVQAVTYLSKQYAALVQWYGTSDGSGEAVDFNYDGLVDLFDFNMLVRERWDNQWLGVMGLSEGFHQYTVIQDYEVEIVRGRLQWWFTEIEPGVDDWSYAYLMDEYAAQDKQIHVTFKVGGGNGSFWAVEPPPVEQLTGHCSWTPTDIRDTPHPEYGYSQLYYSFVERTLERYHGQIDTLIIENEPDTLAYWCQSGDPLVDVEHYLRLVETAKLAVENTDPRVRLANGALTSVNFCNWLIRDFLENDQDQQALTYWEGCFRNRPRAQNPMSAEDLQAYVSSEPEVSMIARMDAFLDSRLPELVDVFNMHYTATPEYRKDIIGRIRTIIGDDVPLMDAELATIQKEAPERYEEGAKELVKLVTQSYVLDIRPVIWFTPELGDYRHTGVINPDTGEYYPQMIGALKLMLAVFNQSITQVVDRSSSQYERYEFVTPQESFQVIWPVSEAGGSVEIPGPCRGFTYAGDEVEGSISQVFPLIVRCPE